MTSPFSKVIRDYVIKEVIVSFTTGVVIIGCVQLLIKRIPMKMKLSELPATTIR
jgi:hypothetical protein